MEVSENRFVWNLEKLSPGCFFIGFDKDKTPIYGVFTYTITYTNDKGEIVCKDSPKPEDYGMRTYRTIEPTVSFDVNGSPILHFDISDIKPPNKPYSETTKEELKDELSFAEAEENYWLGKVDDIQRSHTFYATPETTQALNNATPELEQVQKRVDNINEYLKMV